MYNFIDVNDVYEASENMLPSEALMLNGEYIENLIEGYRTLQVTGREALSPELTTYETGVRDGSAIKNKRYPARTITVKYQLIAESSEAFRSAYNKLGGILNVSNAEMIFHDEPDMFYTGTPSAIGEVEPGRNAVTGEIEFLCVDPFKYSVVEYEAEQSLDDSSILVDYGGTYKAFPTLEAAFYSEENVSEDGEMQETLTGKGDCGYVAFFTEDEKIIQIGDPDEVDSEKKFEKAQTMLNQTFNTASAWGTAAKGLWALNNGHLIPEDVSQLGSIGMNIASYAVPAHPKETSGTIFTGKSDSGQPSFNYRIVARSYSRNANSVKVQFTITASLGSSGSYFGRGYGLVAYIYVGGTWHSVRLKGIKEYWRGKTAHTVNISVTVAGLSATTSALSGMKFKVTKSADSASGSAGVVAEKACKNLAISQYVADVPETYFLSPTGYGSAAGKWHGVSITREIGVDAAGETGAKDFTLTYKQKMSIGSSSSATKQLGAFQAQLSDTGGSNIAGVRIQKNNAGKTATIIYYLKGVKVGEITVDLSYNNKSFGAKESAVKTSTITKSGIKVTFNVAGVAKTFTDDTIENLKVYKITFSFEQYSTSAALSYNGLYWVKFVKNNCDQYRDIPNKFSADDVVEANCRNGEIKLNGVPTPLLGALGNDWEGFCLTPGLNQIGTAYSEWVEDEYKPTFKVRYREVFL